MKHLNRISEKLKEADFFFERMLESERTSSDLNYYFSAFVNAARSVTFVIQHTGNKLDGFDEWYKWIREKLADDAALNNACFDGIDYVFLACDCRPCWDDTIRRCYGNNCRQTHDTAYFYRDQSGQQKDPVHDRLRWCIVLLK